MDPRRSRKLVSVFAIALIATALFILITKTRRRWGRDSELDDFYVGPLILNDQRDIEAHGVLAPAMKKEYRPSQSSKFGYVSLLCDDSSIAQARVLAHSLRKVKAEYPLVFLVLPFVTKTDELVALGAEIEKVPVVPVPFVRPNGKRPAFSCLCRYAKIHAWSMTRFEKAVFIDTNMLIVNVHGGQLQDTLSPDTSRTSTSCSSMKSFPPSRLSGMSSTLESLSISPLHRPMRR